MSERNARPGLFDAALGRLLLFAGLALGLWLRVAGFSEPALFGDEFHTLDLSSESFGTIATTFDGFGSHIVLPLLQHAGLAALGDGTASLRLPALIPGVLTLLLLYPIARAFVGRTPAILATLIFAVSPMHVYYSRFGRSYALLVLLELLLAFFVLRASSAGGRGRRGSWIAVMLLGALIPYTHLSAAGFVAGLALVALALAWREREAGASLRSLLPPICSFGTAALLCGLLFLPLIDQLGAYFTRWDGVAETPTTWFGIPLLLAGGEVSAWLWGIGFPAGLWVLAGRRRDVALVCLAALAGLLVTLLANMPNGMEYAYARYLMGALPFMTMAIAVAGCALVRRFIPSAVMGERVALLVGTALIAASLFEGPLVAGTPQTGAFDNSYLAMRKLPAFDLSWPGAPEIYAEIAARPGPVHVVEVPPINSRASLLYRNHALRHGKRVSLGWPAEPTVAMQEALFVDLSAVAKGDVDYVIVHRDLTREVLAYWDFVYQQAWPAIENAADKGFMERHRAHRIAGQPQTTAEFAAAIATTLRQQLGPASYKDKYVWVWKL